MKIKITVLGFLLFNLLQANTKVIPTIDMVIYERNKDLLSSLSSFDADIKNNKLSADSFSNIIPWLNQLSSSSYNLKKDLTTFNSYIDFYYCLNEPDIKSKIKWEIKEKLYNYTNEILKYRKDVSLDLLLLKSNIDNDSLKLKVDTLNSYNSEIILHLQRFMNTIINW